MQSAPLRRWLNFSLIPGGTRWVFLLLNFIHLVEKIVNFRSAVRAMAIAYCVTQLSRLFFLHAE